MDDKKFLLIMSAILLAAIITVTVGAVLTKPNTIPIAEGPPLVVFPDGHDYYRIDMKGAYCIPIHCPECRKCKEVEK